MIEGVVRYLDGDPILAAEGLPTPSEPSPAALAEVVRERDFQYCTEVLIKGTALPPSNDVRAAMHDFGGSVVVANVGDLLKIHVHTDTPEAVFTLAERWGTVTARKADDMWAQHRRLGEHGATRRVAVVVDSTNDLSDATLDRHGIISVPMQIVFGTETFRDRVDLKPAEFYRRMRTSGVIPTTSQPAPAEFVRAFRDARGEADEVVAVLVSSGLSGTHASAQAAVRAAGLTGVSLVDSHSASLGVGMLALRALELAEAGWSGPAIAGELERIRDQSGVILTVDTFDNLLRSGRVSRGKAWLGGLLDIHPLLELDRTGRIIPAARVRGRDQVVPRALALLDQRLTPRPARIRFGVVHAEAPETAERVRDALVAAYRPIEVLTGSATGVLGAHVGEGAWAVFYQVEDGVQERPVG
jgi:DegV family protein with EDD domain